MVGLRAVLHAVHAVDLDRRVGDVVADHPEVRVRERALILCLRRMPLKLVAARRRDGQKREHGSKASIGE